MATEVTVPCPTCETPDALAKVSCAGCGELLWSRTSHSRPVTSAPNIKMECGVLPGFHFCAGKVCPAGKG